MDAWGQMCPTMGSSPPTAARSSLHPTALRGPRALRGGEEGMCCALPCGSGLARGRGKEHVSFSFLLV